MKFPLKIILLIAVILLLVVIVLRTFSNEDDWICVNGEWIKHGNPSASKPTSPCESSCTIDTDCQTPPSFLMQSNCPFTSACINSKCKVICPIFQSECSNSEDCDCSWRGEKSLDCLCLKNECVSVEG